MSDMTCHGHSYALQPRADCKRNAKKRCFSRVMVTQSIIWDLFHPYLGPVILAEQDANWQVGRQSDLQHFGSCSTNIQFVDCLTIDNSAL